MTIKILALTRWVGGRCSGYCGEIVVPSMPPCPLLSPPGATNNLLLDIIITIYRSNN